MPADAIQIASISRALAVLDLLASESREFGVTEVSTTLGLSKPVVSRVLAVLADEGELIRNEKSGQYSLTLKRPLRSIRFLESMGEQARWMSVLSEVSALVGELVELTLFHAGRLACVASVERSDRTLRIASTLGQTLPLHATASGKAWLAYTPRSIAIPLLLKDGLSQLTVRTITSLDVLLSELEQVGARGYAIAESEFDDGASAVAAPVLLGTRSEWIVGTVHIACPTSRSLPDRLHELGLTVRLTAHRLAHNWPSIMAGAYLLPVEGSTTQNADAGESETVRAPTTAKRASVSAGRPAEVAGRRGHRPARAKKEHHQ